MKIHLVINNLYQGLTKQSAFFCEILSFLRGQQLRSSPVRWGGCKRTCQNNPTFPLGSFMRLSQDLSHFDLLMCSMSLLDELRLITKYPLKDNPSKPRKEPFRRLAEPRPPFLLQAELKFAKPILCWSSSLTYLDLSNNFISPCISSGEGTVCLVFSLISSYGFVLFAPQRVFFYSHWRFFSFFVAVSASLCIPWGVV